MLDLRFAVKEGFRRRFGDSFLFATPFENPEYVTNIRRSLAVGLFHQTAIKTRAVDGYTTVHQNQPGLLHPESALLGAKHEWVVYNESRLSGIGFAMGTHEY